MQAHHSSDNGFLDLACSVNDAQNLRIRSDLMMRLCKLIEARGLTQVQAAELLKVSQPRISDLTRSKIQRFSIDSLIAMLGHAGVHVSVNVNWTEDQSDHWRSFTVRHDDIDFGHL